MDRYIKDGKVGILISPGFGAGWSTWNAEYPNMLFDVEIIEAILGDNKNLAKDIAERKYPEAYLGGLRGLEVIFLDKGTRFIIEEYDGSEYIKTFDDLTFVA